MTRVRDERQSGGPQECKRICLVVSSENFGQGYDQNKVFRGKLPDDSDGMTEQQVGYLSLTFPVYIRLVTQIFHVWPSHGRRALRKGCHKNQVFTGPRSCLMTLSERQSIFGGGSFLSFSIWLCLRRCCQLVGLV